MFYIYKKINYSLIISVDLFLLGAPLESLRNPGKYKGSQECCSHYENGVRDGVWWGMELYPYTLKAKSDLEINDIYTIYLDLFC